MAALSGQPQARTHKRLMLSDLRESGSIEQDADRVPMIYRDKCCNPKTPDCGIREMFGNKHRNSPVGTIKLLFEPEATRYPIWRAQPKADLLSDCAHRHMTAKGLLWYDNTRDIVVYLSKFECINFLLKNSY